MEGANNEIREASATSGQVLSVEHDAAVLEAHI